ncbi:MAG: uracil phosphoribosyltransferase [Flavobacteriaceae bacterium]|nr:uracil phosphoribosyltransferase [Flavobacteriaceae bacterium]
MKALFEGIESITDAILLSPLDGIRELELTSWAMANGLNWIFVIIGFGALIYWLKELRKYDQEGSEDYTSTSHSYLG